MFASITMSFLYSSSESPVSEFWINGGLGSYTYGYGYTVAVIAIILICQFLNSRFRFGSRAQPVTASPHVESISVSQYSPSDVRITSVISDLDLKNLIDDINEKSQANEKWDDVINRRTDRLFYSARCCKPKGGSVPLKYLSITVFENCSVATLRDFYMDNDFRRNWDKTLIEHKQLQVDISTGTEIGLMIKKFPLLTPREYVLAWRVWEAKDGSFYCFTKECEYPFLSQTRNKKKYVRVGLFRSGWRIKKVSGRNACEIKMVHQEDAGLNIEMAKLAFAKGIWSYVCKMDDALRRYSKRSEGAITLIQKVPLELEDTLNNTSSDYSHEVSREQSRTRQQTKAPLNNNMVPDMLMLLGGVVCLSRGISNFGAKVAMACILSKLVKRSALRRRSLQRFSPENDQNGP